HTRFSLDWSADVCSSDLDLYFQHSEQESGVLENDIVREASYNLDHGVGARVVSGDKTGFAYSDDLSPASLRQALAAARAIVRHKTGRASCRERMECRDRE